MAGSLAWVVQKPGFSELVCGVGPFNRALIQSDNARTLKSRASVLREFIGSHE